MRSNVQYVPPLLHLVLAEISNVTTENASPVIFMFQAVITISLQYMGQLYSFEWTSGPVFVCNINNFTHYNVKILWYVKS